MQSFNNKPVWATCLSLFILLNPGFSFSQALAQEDPAQQAPAAVNANTGLSNESIIGNGNMQAEDTGVAVNGSVNDSNLNNNQNTLANQNLVRSTVLVPTQAGGGNSALIMPRNPLPMPNAALGRSNFGMQVGVQNNPGLSALTGGGSSLGWFMQAGLNIPFGKIPEPYRNGNSSRLDDVRLRQQQADRQVFAKPQPKAESDGDKNVKGRVVGLNAYNYNTVPSSRLQVPEGDPQIAPISMMQPRVLALSPADVYTRPLNTGERIGLVEVGKEYPYLGHTRSGWVKVLLPNGAEGWTSTNFEYIKYDFTEVDTLAVDPKAGKPLARHEKPITPAEKKKSGS